jgi:hypothetical protein
MAQGARARSGTLGPGHAIRIGRRGLEAGQGRRARVREAVPTVQVVQSGSDGGDQRQAKGAGRACAKRYPRLGRAIKIGRRRSDRGGVNGCGRRCSSPRR